MKYIKGYTGYIICMSLLLISIYLCIGIYNKYQDNQRLTMYNFKFYKEIKEVKMVYPKFNINIIDNKINELINNYKDKNIDYELYLDENTLNIFFTISEDNKYIYKNIDYDIKNNKLNNVIDYNLYKDIILDKVKSKYETNIYEIINNDNFNNSSYKINEDGIYFYFNDNLFDKIYKVYIYLPSNNESEVFNKTYDKIVAFTFDDGPSEYTMEIVNTLVLNNSKATFFELGNRMKYNQEIVKNVLNNEMEIGSHTYAHKNLNKLTIEEIDEEINSTNIIFNEITGENIKLLRPPYGNANELVKSRVNTPIITWNIDTNDWLYKDSEHVYNHIIENIESGDIILMHDVYSETVEAVKKVVPYLIEKGYKITTVSELAKYNNIELKEKEVYRSLKVIE